MTLVSVIATREVICLSTTFVYPPIPDRGNDWSAIDSNTYDADCQDGSFVSTSAHGTGATEFEAITDLLEQIEDRWEHFCPRCNRKHDCEDIPCRVTGLCPDCEIECHDFDDEGD